MYTNGVRTGSLDWSGARGRWLGTGGLGSFRVQGGADGGGEVGDGDGLGAEGDEVGVVGAGEGEYGFGLGECVAGGGFGLAAGGRRG